MTKTLNYFPKKNYTSLVFFVVIDPIAWILERLVLNKAVMFCLERTGDDLHSGNWQISQTLWIDGKLFVRIYPKANSRRIIIRWTLQVFFIELSKSFGHLSTKFMWIIDTKKGLPPLMPEPSQIFVDLMVFIYFNGWLVCAIQIPIRHYFIIRLYSSFLGLLLTKI